MNKFYNKSELGFAIFWIVAYLVLASVADGISATLGIEKSITSLVLLIMSTLLLIWIIRNKHTGKFGLCMPKDNAKYYLYYIPLIIMITMNVWFGFSLNYTVLESILYVISMLCVGFLEEIIFRGLLFKAMAKDNIMAAIIVSSVTFGIGHIINLFTSGGANILPNICQVFYAMAAGFLFVIIFYRGGSLIPCIVTHGLFNALSCFMNYSTVTPMIDIIMSIILIVLNVGYALILMKLLPRNNTTTIEHNNINITDK